MKLGNERGAILVTALLVLVLLTLLASGAMLSSTLDTKLTGTIGKNLKGFYAAETGLNIGVATLIDTLKADLAPYHPSSSVTITPTTPIDGTNFDGYKIEYSITNGHDTNAPDSDPLIRVLGSSVLEQPITNYVYEYKIDSTATALSGPDVQKALEIVKITETPLLQYFIYTNDDLTLAPETGDLLFPLTTNWTPSEPSTWGRIFTGGNFAKANTQTTYFREVGSNGGIAPDFLFVGGDITTPTTAPFAIRGTALAAVNAANQAEKEALYTVGGIPHVRRGVDNPPAITRNHIQRYDAGITNSGYYEGQAANPTRNFETTGSDDVIGVVLSLTGGHQDLRITVNGVQSANLFADLTNYRVATGVPVEIARWPLDARRRAADTEATSATTIATANPASDMVNGSIIYSVEDPVGGAIYIAGPNKTHTFSSVSPWTVGYTSANLADPDGSTYSGMANPWYPCVLEYADGTPTNNMPVNLTVIDMQQFQAWLYDYLDNLDGGGYDSSVDTVGKSVLMYVSRTIPGTYTAGTRLDAIKIIGSQAGRTRGNTIGHPSPGSEVGATTGIRQSNGTLRFRTTLITPEPVYFEGDFNAPGAEAVDFSPGQGCAVICDTATFLSNGWSKSYGTFSGVDKSVPAGGVPSGLPTAVNTALYTGSISGMPGILNLAGFLENLSGVTFYFAGSLINIWESEREPHDYDAAYYTRPNRSYGWDTGFMSPNYWPPYAPGYWSIERTTWQKTY